MASQWDLLHGSIPNDHSRRTSSADFVKSVAPTLSSGAVVLDLGCGATVSAGVVVIPQTGAGWLSVFPCSQGHVVTSTVNDRAGVPRSNAVVVDASQGGECVRTMVTSHVVFDTFATAS